MAVAFNNASATHTSSGGGGSVSFSYTSSSGSDRLLLAGARDFVGGAISAVTYAGASLTSSGSVGSLTAWRKTAPATGANTVTFTGASYTTFFTGVQDFTGVDGTTPLGTAVTNTGTSTALSTGSITVPSNGMSAGFGYQAYYNNGAGAITAGTNTTLAGVTTYGYRMAGGYSTTTGSLNWNAPGSAAWEALGFPINPVASGGTVALTGNTETLTVGTVVPSLSLAITGQTETLTQGTVTPNLSLALTGNTETLTAGTVVPSLTVALTGNTATLTAGTVSIPGGVALTGNTETLTQGTVTPSLTVSLTGNTATLTAGTVTPNSPDLTVALTGNTSTLTAGLLSIGTDSTTDTHDGYWADQWRKKHKKKPVPDSIEEVQELVSEVIKKAEKKPSILPKAISLPDNTEQRLAVVERLIQQLQDDQDEDDTLALILML